MKRIFAVAPYQHKGGICFKTKAYEAWIEAGGKTATPHYPMRRFHFIAHRIPLPSIWKSKKEARLRFVQPVTMRFDTFPDYSLYEIIPFMWDTWEPYHNSIVDFFIRHHVRTAIFCSSQSAEVIKKRIPNLNVIVITEGIDTTIYHEGKPLREREIDLLEFGRQNSKVFQVVLPNGIIHLKSQKGKKLFMSDNDFRYKLSNSKITVAFPKHDTCPEETGFVETLTQRYWENMLSRVVMIGKAPQELIKEIGYNPVIDIDKESPKEQIIDILNHIDEYQSLVDRNREIALKHGDWSTRMKFIMNKLGELGYII